MRPPFEEALRQSKRHGEIVSIHYNPHDYEEIYCGLVDCVCNGEFRLETYRRYGCPDGWFTMRLGDIISMDVGGRFEQRMAFLMMHKPSPPLGLRLPPVRKGSVITGTLRQAKEADLLVSVYTTGAQYALFGSVHALDSHELVISSIDTFGERSGLVVERLDHVRGVELGSSDCLTGQYLREHQAEFIEFRKQQTT